jgi:hypothetical protein
MTEIDVLIADFNEIHKHPLSAFKAVAFSMTARHSPHTMKSSPFFRHQPLRFPDAGLTEEISFEVPTSRP